MPHDYQLFLFNAANHVVHGHVATCGGDAEAMKVADYWLARYTAVEVWQLGRLIGRLPRPS